MGELQKLVQKAKIVEGEKVSTANLARLRFLDVHDMVYMIMV